MMMEIFLNEEKAERNGIDIKECYEVIDKFFINRGIKKLGKGVYWGEESQNSFDAFAIAVTQFPDTDWFLNVVDEWYWRVDSDDLEDRENVLKGYYKTKEILEKVEL